MKLKLKTKEVKSAGVVSMKHLDKDGNILGERNFNNLLTDAYFAQNSLSPSAYIQIGTGTTPPEVTDTSLENFHQGGTSTSGTWAGVTDFSGPAETATKINRHTRNQTFSFSSPVLITEVGLGSTSSGGTLYARSLIKDEDGIPAPFQMDAGHQLSVSYAVEVELPQQLTEIATIASPWPAPYDGDISVVIAARSGGSLTNYTSIGLVDTRNIFATPTINVNRALGKITYTLNRTTAFDTSDTPLQRFLYNTTIGGLDYYSAENAPSSYHICFRQEGPGTDRRVVVPANHNFSIEFETGINWGRKP